MSDRSSASRRSQSRRSQGSPWRSNAAEALSVGEGGGGGGGRYTDTSRSRISSHNSSISSGTSLIAFHSKNAFKLVCGASCGDGNAFCVRMKPCAVASHKGKGPMPSLKPGVYV